MRRLKAYLLVAAGLAAAGLLAFVALRGPSPGDTAGPDAPPGPPADTSERPGGGAPGPLADDSPGGAGEASGTKVVPDRNTRPETAKVPSVEDIEALLKAGYRSEALDLLDIRLKRYPEDARALEIRGGLFLEDGAYRKAARDLRTSIRTGGETCEKLVTFADALYRHDDRGATKALKRAIELDPRAARPHSLLAQIHLRKGETKEAKEEVRKALELDSREPLAVSLSQRLLR